MVGVSRGGPALAAPVSIIDLTTDFPECEAPRAAALKVLDSQADVCKHEMESRTADIHAQEDAITASRRTIETIERNLNANRAARDNWSKNQRQSADFATENQHKLEDFDDKLKAARKLSSQLEKELSTSKPEKSGAIKKKIAQNAADLQNLSDESRAKLVKARDLADKITQFMQAQIDTLKQDETALKASKKQEESKIDDANDKVKDLRKRIERQEDLLKQIDERKSKVQEVWLKCCREVWDARSK